MADEAKKYLLLSVEDALLLYGAILGLSMTQGGLPKGRITRIAERLRDDSGGDLRDIAARLKKLEICGACSIEGQASYCASLFANKLGRRLARLIERADATAKPPGGTP